MTISSSLNAGVSGLSANATRLAAISDNIANSSTNGYRRVETDFHSLVIGKSGGVYTAGGVRTTNNRLIDQAGSLISTNSSTDLAVQGRGMLPVARHFDGIGVAPNSQMLLTSTGSFQIDKDGYLVTQSGLVLMGFKADENGNIAAVSRDTDDSLMPVKIETQRLLGEPTTKIEIAANIPATDTEPTASGEPRQLTVEYFDNMGTIQNLQFEFTPDLTGSQATNTWTLQIKDSAQQFAAVGEYSVEFNDGRANGGTLKSVTAITGGSYDPTSGAFIIDVAGGPLEISVGMLGDGFGLTQKADIFTPASVEKNGMRAGNMTSLIQIDNAGNVFATFDNGATKVIYKVPLVDMPNMNGMISLDDQTYTPSIESGKYFLWNAGEGPTGSITSYALEESSTDVASELTSMIQTQRSYSSNAKVIQTASEILQETTNMIR